MAPSWKENTDGYSTEGLGNSWTKDNDHWPQVATAAPVPYRNAMSMKSVTETPSIIYHSTDDYSPPSKRSIVGPRGYAIKRARPVYVVACD